MLNGTPRNIFMSNYTGGRRKGHGNVLVLDCGREKGREGM